MIKTSKKFCALVALLFGFTHASNGAITLSIDYSLDSNGFFSDGDGSTAVIKKAALEAAAGVLESIITDSVGAMPAGAGGLFNTWSITGTHPGTGAGGTVFDVNPTIAADTLVIYAGGRLLGGSTLGQGGPGGFSAGNGGLGDFAAFVDNIRNRGEAGITDGAGTALATQTDFAPWGGTITFDNDPAGQWHYDHTTAVTAGKSDFYSVALHELTHVLGIGIANSWTTKVTGGGGVFTGANSTTSNGGANPGVNAGGDHFVNGIMSVTLAGSIAQEAMMDPSLTVGSRKLFTNLDAMGLSDIGWDVNVAPVPEPSFYVTLVGLGLAGFGVMRRKLS